MRRWRIRLRARRYRKRYAAFFVLFASQIRPKFNISVSLYVVGASLYVVGASRNALNIASVF